MLKFVAMYYHRAIDIIFLIHVTNCCIEMKINKKMSKLQIILQANLVYNNYILYTHKCVCIYKLFFFLYRFFLNIKTFLMYSQKTILLKIPN